MSNRKSMAAMRDVLDGLFHDLSGPNGADSLIDALAERGIVLISDPCLVKLRDGEPYFVLRGQDLLADDLVDEWASRLENQLDGSDVAIDDDDPDVRKIDEARACAEAMRNWSPRKMPD